MQPDLEVWQQLGYWHVEDWSGDSQWKSCHLTRKHLYPVQICLKTSCFISRLQFPLCYHVSGDCSCHPEVCPLFYQAALPLCGIRKPSNCRRNHFILGEMSKHHVRWNRHICYIYIYTYVFLPVDWNVVSLSCHIHYADIYTFIFVSCL